MYEKKINYIITVVSSWFLGIFMLRRIQRIKKVLNSKALFHDHGNVSIVNKRHVALLPCLTHCII